MALTANRPRAVSQTNLALQGEKPGTPNQEYFEGAIVAFNLTGDVIPAVDSAGVELAGICAEKVVNGDGETNDVKYEWGFLEEFPVSPAGALNESSLGKNAFVLDDEFVTNNATAEGNVRLGRIVDFPRPGFVTVHVGVLADNDA